MGGWIKLHRQILDNPVVCKDAEYFAVWCYLLLNATHEEIQVVFNGKKVKLQAGQLITCRQSIAEKLNVSSSKIHRILNTFEIDQQIEQQTTRHGRLVTLLNWQSYQNLEQPIEQQVNNQWTTSGQPVNSNKNVRTKECKKKILKDIPSKNNYADLVTLTADEYQKIVAKVGGETEAAELIEILNNYKASSGKKYKSDYFTLLGWPLDRYNETLEKRARRGGGGNYSGSKKQVDILGEIAKARSNFDEGV